MNDTNDKGNLGEGGDFNYSLHIPDIPVDLAFSTETEFNIVSFNTLVDNMPLEQLQQVVKMVYEAQYKQLVIFQAMLKECNSALGKCARDNMMMAAQLGKIPDSMKF